MSGTARSKRQINVRTNQFSDVPPGVLWAVREVKKLGCALKPFPDHKFRQGGVWRVGYGRLIGPYDHDIVVLETFELEWLMTTLHELYNQHKGESSSPRELRRHILELFLRRYKGVK